MYYCGDLQWFGTFGKSPGLFFLELKFYLQEHDLIDLFKRSNQILREYFGAVAENEVAPGMAGPQELPDHQGFSFNVPMAPNSGFQFN